MLFQCVYTLNNVTMATDKTCQGPLTPPIPLMKIWKITVKQCGGLLLAIPANMFFRSTRWQYKEFDNNIEKIKWFISAKLDCAKQN